MEPPSLRRLPLAHVIVRQTPPLLYSDVLTDGGHHVWPYGGRRAPCFLRSRGHEVVEDVSCADPQWDAATLALSTSITRF